MKCVVWGVLIFSLLAMGLIACAPKPKPRVEGEEGLTISVAPQTVRVGENVLITVEAKNIYLPKQVLFLEISVLEEQGLWRIKLWPKVVQVSSGIPGLQPQDTLSEENKSHRFEAKKQGQYKVRAWLYTATGKRIDKKEVLFKVEK